MKYKDYVKKYQNILEPIDQELICIPILVILETVMEEYPNGEFTKKVIKMIEKEKNRIHNSEFLDDSKSNAKHLEDLEWKN